MRLETSKYISEQKQTSCGVVQGREAEGKGVVGRGGRSSSRALSGFESISHPPPNIYRPGRQPGSVRARPGPAHHLGVHRPRQSPHPPDLFATLRSYIRRPHRHPRRTSLPTPLHLRLPCATPTPNPGTVRSKSHIRHSMFQRLPPPSFCWNRLLHRQRQFGQHSLASEHLQRHLPRPRIIAFARYCSRLRRRLVRYPGRMWFPRKTYKSINMVCAHSGSRRRQKGTHQTNERSDAEQPLTGRGTFLAARNPPEIQIDSDRRVQMHSTYHAVKHRRNRARDTSMSAP